MSDFVASNGVRVWRDIFSGRVRFEGNAVDLDNLREKLRGDCMGFSPSAEVALLEFVAHEAAKKPWDDAQRDDVWLFKSETKRGLALAWRAEDSWDVIDKRGNFHSAIQDVPQEMRDHAFYGWDNPTAERIYRIERPES